MIFFYQLFCCISVRDFKPKILIKGPFFILQIWRKKMFNKKLIFSLERQVDMHIVYLKKYKSICHHTTFYSIFNTSSCRKPEIQNDLPKITQNKWIWSIFLTNSGQKSLTMLISPFLTTIQLILINRQIKNCRQAPLNTHVKIL